ncbi:MAG: FAD-dependent oxidoreductase, partial [Planctomycetaceae bacterium]|nr:FAD-dependent oxidoreductase [Planctomycetaceae bacterium]
DLHLPEPKYQKGFEGDEFISVAHYTKFPSPYWIPYRCFYSRNIENLFMAGRDISVTHEGLGTSRVMRTGGCMGEIVGMAASLCKKHNTTPRGVYQIHLTELKSLMDKGVTPSPEFAPPKPKSLKPTAGNQTTKAVVTVSSNTEHAKNLNDGILDLNSNESRWISGKADQHEIVFEWNEPVTVNSVRIISGYTTAGSTIAPISDFRLQNKQNGEWIDILRSDVAGNSKIDYQKQFPETATKSLRLIITGTHDKIARIWEIEFYKH